MGQLARFETRGLAASERLERWGEFLAQSPGRLLTRSLGSEPLDGYMAVATLGPMRLFHLRASPHRIERPAGLPSERPMVRILVQGAGEAVLSQGGTEIRLKPGQWTAWSTDRPHAVDNITPVEWFGLLIPLDVLGLRSADIVRQGVAPLGSERGICQLIPDYIRQLYHQVSAIDEPWKTEMSDVMLHLVRLALSEAASKTPRTTVRESMRSRLVDYVRHNLRDPGLSVEQVATKFGISKRYVHKLFNADGATMSQFLWQERLERCRAALGDEDMAGRSITEIAFLWGFNNSAHFSKMFRNRYGMSPTQFRNHMAPSSPAPEYLS